MTVGGLGPVVGGEHHCQSVSSDVNTRGVDVDTVVGGDGGRRSIQLEEVNGAMPDGDVHLSRHAGDRTHAQRPNADVVGEVLLVDFRVVPVGGGPREIASFTEGECISELVVQLKGDVAPNAGRHNAFTAAHLERRRRTWKDGHVHGHLLATGWMRHRDGVRTSGIGHEGRAHHGPVGRRDVDCFTREEIAVLVSHLSVDGQGFIGGDGRRQRRNDEVNGGTGRDRDVLRTAHKAKARRDGRDTCGIGCEQSVAADAASGGRPRHGRRLNHGLVIIRHGIEVHRRVCVGGRCARRADGHARDVRGVELHLRSEIDVGGGAGVERGVGVAVVRGRDDHPCLFAGDGHARCTDIEPNPARGVNVDNGGGHGIAVIHTCLHTGCAPRATSSGTVPGGGGCTPVRVGDGVDVEGNRRCTLDGRPRFDVEAKRSRVDLLVLSERHLSGVQGHVDAAFIGPKGPTVGACADGRLAGKVGVGVLAVNGRVLHVGVAKGGDFTAGLEPVRVGVVVVVGVVGVTDGKAPARRGGPWDGLVHALHPPREELTFGEVVFKAERGVRDFRILPRAELVDTGLVGNGDNVARCSAHRRPCQGRLGRGRQQAVVLSVEDLAVGRGGQGGLCRWNDAVHVVHVVQDKMRMVGGVRIF